MHFSGGRLKALGAKHHAFKHAYFYDHYERYLAVDPNAVANVLELGIHEGGSLLVWMEFFPQAEIFGVDLRLVTLPGDNPRVHQLQADQTDAEAIGNFLRSNGVESLDIVIDDCSHVGYLTKQSFLFLFENFLKPGGYYIIEDWHTGYWETWPDGAALAEPDPEGEPRGIFASHDRGMPGFIKQLIDRADEFESIVITGAFVVVKKQSHENRAAIQEANQLWEERGGF
jgi:SAM-dependent methyltransferase